MDSTLVMFNMSSRSEWEAGMVNRNYHILQAIREAKQYTRIVSVDFLPFSFRTRLKVFIKGAPWKRSSRTVSWRFFSSAERDKNDPSLVYVTALSLGAVETLLKKMDIRADETTFWSYNPFASEVHAKYPNAFHVFDAVDNWIEHPSYQSRKAELETHYQTIRRHADVIFTVSEGLLELFEKARNAFFVPNGVAVSHFAGTRCDTAFLPVEQRPVIGYHGVIQSRINIHMLDYVTEKLPDCQFVLAGPVWKDVKKEISKLAKRSNVHVIGMVPYGQLPSLISCFDATIIPHKIDSLTQSMNPLKIYEYLAAGKPIVATAIPGADQFQDLVKLAVSPEEFVQKIQKVLETDNEELVQRRVAMARQHSWKQRLQVMNGAIDRVRQEA